MSKTWEQLLANGRLFDCTPQEMIDRATGSKVPLFVACGLGVNSTAALIMLHRLGDRPDAILFADTSAEKPDTYAYRDTLNDWLRSVNFPEIVTVKRDVDHGRQKHEAKYSTLEEECLVKNCLPSIAYFHRSCSDKWKQEPQEKWANHWPDAQDRWATGGGVRQGHRLRCRRTKPGEVQSQQEMGILASPS